MKTKFVTFSILLVSSYSIAGQAPCVDSAKQGAVKEYRSENGGNGSLNIVATLLETAKKVYTYNVSIKEAANDGANTSYKVSVRAIKGSQCAVEAVTENICEKLYAQAEENCTIAMCDQYKEDSGEEDCHIDGDFMEGLQICVGDVEMPELLKAYNLKNPTAKLNCDDM